MPETRNYKKKGIFFKKNPSVFSEDSEGEGVNKISSEEQMRNYNTFMLN